MNALDELRNKQIDGDENDLERCILRADTEGYYYEADNAAAELAALTAELEAVKRERDELREALNEILSHPFPRQNFDESNVLYERRYKKHLEAVDKAAAALKAGQK